MSRAALEKIAEGLREAIAAARAEALPLGFVNWIATEDELPPQGLLVLVHGGVAHYRAGQWISVTGHDWPGRPMEWAPSHWARLPVPPAA